MAYIHNRNITNNHFILFSILLIGTTLLFLILQPKISSLLVPQRQSYLLDSFLQKVKREKNIDPQEYWEFREFYSHGYFSFNKSGLSHTEVIDLLKKVPINIGTNDITILAFQSPKSSSLELLTSASTLSSFVKMPSGAQLIKQNDQELVYKNGNLLTVILMYPISEMQKANGFFDYNDVDKDMLKGKYWLTATSFSMP